MKQHFAPLLGWIAVLSLTLWTLPTVAAASDEESSVRPGVNDKFLAPDLDVAEYEEIFEGESREIFRSRAAIVAALAIEPGMQVADIGAGTGLFLAPFAAAVGSGGRVFAVDISPVFVAHLKQRAGAARLDQVSVVLSSDRSVELAENSVDRLFVCDVYHHFEFPRATLASMLHALRPGGELWVIDFERIPGTTREWIVDHVRAGKDVFTAEITEAGFEIVEEVAIDGISENYTLRFRAP